MAHLHVFKSDGANERELERVEIGADSVVFVTDEEVGGRRGVVKVGGVGGAEMTLSMADQSEWIDAIKQAVLSERYDLLCVVEHGSAATHNGLLPLRIDPYVPVWVR